MKRFLKYTTSVLLLALLAGCSNHIEDLAVGASDIAVDVATEFKTLILTYQAPSGDSTEGTATVAGLTGDDVVYSWLLDGDELSETSASCTIDESSLSVGHHKLFVEAELDGQPYSAEYTIVITRND